MEIAGLYGGLIVNCKVDCKCSTLVLKVGLQANLVMLGGSQPGQYVVFSGQITSLLILFSCGFSLLSVGGAVACDSVMSCSEFRL